MILVIVLLAIWPFHKKPAVDESPKPCEKSGKLWFYADEGVIGWSEVSCAGAYYNWKNSSPKPVWIKRA